MLAVYIRYIILGCREIFIIPSGMIKSVIKEALDDKRYSRLIFS